MTDQRLKEIEEAQASYEELASHDRRNGGYAVAVQVDVNRVVEVLGELLREFKQMRNHV